MLRLGLCVLGIYACFLTWGVLQERVSTTTYGEGQKFRYFIFLNAVQSLAASCVAYLYLKFNRRDLGNPSWELLKNYAQVAVTNVLASPFGYASLKHIDYPTLILGKSCKLVPVMLMNVVLYRRKFPLYKYVTVFLVTLGVSAFMLLQPVKKASGTVNSLYGLFLLTINLLMDGATNSTQDQIFRKYKVNGQQMMFFMNLIGSGLMFLWLLNPWNSELSEALQFCSSYPGVIKDILTFSICGAVGQCFIFYVLESYGSLSLVTVTVTRKMFTMLLSVFWFNHHFSSGQWIGVALVFAGIGLEAYVKRAEALNKQRPSSPVQTQFAITSKETKKSL
ncbi:UAA transporter [Basidiobolus meristosporus CBS 931.73]|uniref:UDP-galactose transporter homolog 1 n=1 Tax=Basidiobolus meristosporus CBS 931.73 TaxID=1314790 RepID=A0A1Y1XSE1_9FUNG|nr:UAA transporter [Basidiobolus meristosporus CBS 931.73]|eukprot:ORX88416.1 UAA transporter [Basidiobolus meristosporus CBS 931.73]